MKTLSARFTFVILTGIALVTVFSGCEKRLAIDEEFKFKLKIGKDPGQAGPVFADVDKKILDPALSALKTNLGKCYLAFKDANGNVTDPYPPCTDSNIITDKVIRSAKAKNGPAEDSAANDPNITYRVYSNNLNDIRAVVASFSPTPAPTH
jgi:hypothetical protein